MYEAPEVLASYDADEILAEAETSSGHNDRDDSDHEFRLVR